MRNNEMENQVLTLESLKTKKKPNVRALIIVVAIVLIVFIGDSLIGDASSQGFSIERVASALLSIVPTVIFGVIIIAAYFLYISETNKRNDAINIDDLQIVEDEIYDRDYNSGSDDDPDRYYIFGKLTGRHTVSSQIYCNATKCMHFYLVTSKPKSASDSATMRTVSMLSGGAITSDGAVSYSVYGIFLACNTKIGADLLPCLISYDKEQGDLAFEQYKAEAKRNKKYILKVKCQYCGSKFNYNKNDGVCPECNRKYVIPDADIIHETNWYKDSK